MSDLLDICTGPASWHLGRCAEVRAGDHVTRYVRRGSGSPPIVVVGANGEHEPIWAPLVETLAATHRIVVPQPPQADADYIAWLRGFVEGIGLSAVVLIAGGVTCGPAIELATSDAFTFCGVVLVPHNGEPPIRPEHDGQASLPRTLILLPEWTAGEVVQRVEQFIAGLSVP